jgi:hypothetical protein
MEGRTCPARGPPNPIPSPPCSIAIEVLRSLQIPLAQIDIFTSVEGTGWWLLGSKPHHRRYAMPAHVALSLPRGPQKADMDQRPHPPIQSNPGAARMTSLRRCRRATSARRTPSRLRYSAGGPMRTAHNSLPRPSASTARSTTSASSCSACASPKSTSLSRQSSARRPRSGWAWSPNA